MITENDIAQNLGESGWAGDIENFQLRPSQLDELANVYDLREPQICERFQNSLNAAVVAFCMTVKHYHDLKKNKKITTHLRDQSILLQKHSAGLLAALNSISDYEADILLEEHLPDAQSSKVFIDQLTFKLHALNLCIEHQDIQVERSTVSFLKPLVLRCIEIVEEATGREVVRGLDPMSGKADGIFYEFLVTLNEHLPDEIKQILPQKTGGFDKVIREALKDRNRLKADE